MKPLKKAQKRLDARVNDFNATMKTPSDSKVEQRKNTGGYTKPGSMQKKG